MIYTFCQLLTRGFGMYRETWDADREREPRNVRSTDVIGNKEWYDNMGGGVRQSRTYEENSELMFLGCMQVRTNFKKLNILTRRFPTVSYALVSAGANLAHFGL